MKKGILLFSLVAMIFAVGATFAGTGTPVKELAPVKGLPFLDSPGPLAVRPTVSSAKGSERSLFFVDSHGQQHHMVFDPMAKHKGVVDTLRWFVGGPYDNNDYTDAYDTNFIWFYPVAECSLLEVWGNFHDQAASGSQKISIAGLCYEEQGDACADTCCPFGHLDYPWTSMSEDESDTFAISLSGNLLPSALSWNVAGGDQWSKMDFTLYPPGYVLELPPDTAFFVILRACNIDGSPRINWDDCNNFTRQCDPRCAHWLCTIDHGTIVKNCSEVYCSRQWYVYYATEPWSYPEFLVMAVVSYESVPPFIDSLTQVMDSYHPDGSFEVKAGMADLDGEVTEATLSFTVRHSGYTTDLAMNITSDPPIFIGAATISGSFSYLDTIDYWVNCEDDEGKAGVWRGPGDAVKSFVIQEANLKADIFLANDRGGNRDMYYRALLDSLGYEYEYWNVTKSHGLDSTILGYGNWNTAILFGWGCGTLPGKDYTGDMWADFLDQGTLDTPRNIFYTDQDYFCVHDGEDDYPDGCEFEGDLSEGEFLYDYFGVGWAKSDADDQDTLFKGIDGQIVGPYVGQILPLNTDNVDITPWPDYTHANAQAVNVFVAERGNEPSGTRYDGGTFRTVFLPFPFEAVCDYDTLTEEAVLNDSALTVMDSILSWFGTLPYHGVREIPTGGELPQVFTLSQNHPNPFNPVTSIEYAVPKLSEVSLKVYNVLGQEVKTLVNQRQKAGAYRATWNGEDNQNQKVTSGIYFYQLKAKDVSSVRKMILLK